MIDMPYFMTNENWYEFDFRKNMWVLKEGAPPEAVKSYEEYQDELKYFESKHLN